MLSAIGRRRFILSAASLAGGGRASAAGWSPSGPIQVLVSYPPGGSTDTLARLLAREVGGREHWDFVTLNRPGGGGLIMERVISSARPNGQTLGLCASYQLAYSPEGMSAPPFAVTDFRYIGSYAKSPQCIVANAKGPLWTVDDIRAYAKAKGPLSLGVSPPFLWLGELLGRALEIEMFSVPYQGGGELMPALVGGHLDLSLSSGVHIPHERSGAVRVVLSIMHDRLPLNPAVPTAIELGANLTLESRYVLLAPKSLPDGPANALTRAFTATAADPAVQHQISATLGLINTSVDPDQLVAELKAENDAARVQERAGAEALTKK